MDDKPPKPTVDDPIFQTNYDLAKLMMNYTSNHVYDKSSKRMMNHLNLRWNIQSSETIRISLTFLNLEYEQPIICHPNPSLLIQNYYESPLIQTYSELSKNTNPL